MAETVVSFALGEVYEILKDKAKLLRGIHKDFSDIKDELESIQAFLEDADKRVANEANTNDGIRTWVKQNEFLFIEETEIVGFELPRDEL